MPTQRTDHEILLQIHDDVQEIKSNLIVIHRTLWGYEADMGIVARVKVAEDKVEANDRRVGDSIKRNEERIKELEKLAPAMRAVIWIGAAVGVSVIGLIVSLITGQVTMVFGG